MLIQIKSWKTNEVIFELDKENNTLKDTVEEAVLQGIYLTYADLRGADLCGANLHGAVLRFAELGNADLSSVNLIYCDLRDAYLSGANLCGINLYAASLHRSVLTGADLHGADLREANLSGADLSGTDLTGAKIISCFFGNACMDNTIMPDFPMGCPEEGNFIGYKKIWQSKEYAFKNFIVKLEIPEDAKRSSSNTNKCRCSKAKVLEITAMISRETINEITNINVTPCVYKVGEMVYPDSFDKYRWNECSNGIHFFMTEEEAINYY